MQPGLTFACLRCLVRSTRCARSAERSRCRSRRCSCDQQVCFSHALRSEIRNADQMHRHNSISADEGGELPLVSLFLPDGGSLTTDAHDSYRLLFVRQMRVPDPSQQLDEQSPGAFFLPVPPSRVVSIPQQPQIMHARFSIPEKLAARSEIAVWLTNESERAAEARRRRDSRERPSTHRV